MNKANNSEVIVSVLMITYGHEAYISQAINGVLMQETDFKIELIISNDCSPDNTNSIVNEIIETHHKSHLINYQVHKKNLGANNNFIWALKQAKGKYIALCEGDDYWTDPLKLQKQVDFLENNNDFSICFHDVKFIQNDVEISSNIDFGKSTFDILDLAEKNFIDTCSVCYRNLYIEQLSGISNLQIGDYIVHMLNAKNGKIKFLNTTMANYRIHNGGAWSLKNDKFKLENKLECLNYLLKLDFNHKVKKILLKRLFWTNKNLLKYDLKIDRLFAILKIDFLLTLKLLIKNDLF